jgi:FkbM family methyltransferase
MKIYDFIKENFNSHSIIFEIGAHFGEDTRKIYESTGAEIHSFEPDPRNVQFILNSNLSEICKFNPYAVSSELGESEFFLSSGKPNSYIEDDEIRNSDWSLSSSLKKPKDHLEIHPWCKFGDSVKVKTITLDSYVSENEIKKIDFIWMDVQGAEDLVFKGMTNSKNITKYIFTEYCEDGVELYDSAPTRNQILSSLGEGWEILYDFGNTGSGIDVLLKNTKLV